MPVALVYGSVGKHLRRVYVTDTAAALANAVVLAPGEARALMTDAVYAGLDAPGLHLWLASRIGVPTNSGRAVELDGALTVVAAYMADAEIDRPVLSALHTLLAHDEAELGDQRDAGTGRFPALDVRNRAMLQAALDRYAMAKQAGDPITAQLGAFILTRVQVRINDGTITLLAAKAACQNAGLDGSSLTAAP
jgi:hypothetical protein